MSSSDRAEYALIDAATGIIQRIGECEVDDLAFQAGPEQDVIAPIPEGVRDDTHRWDGEAFVALPPRPGPWAVWQDGAWTDPRTPADIEAGLMAARLAAVAAINAASGPIRRLYVTDIPGQEALYLMKEAEARAWVASANPDATQFPLIAAEVGITAPTADEVAQVYLNLAAIYTVAAAQLETVRLGHIAQAEAAPTPEAAAAIAAAFRALFA